MSGERTGPWFRPPWRVRWLGYRRWHRVAFGPACLSFYVYPPGEHLGWRGTRLWASGISWRYIDSGGVGRHTSSFRLWRKQRAAVAARAKAAR